MQWTLQLLPWLKINSDLFGRGQAGSQLVSIWSPSGASPEQSYTVLLPGHASPLFQPIFPHGVIVVLFFIFSPSKL